MGINPDVDDPRLREPLSVLPTPLFFQTTIKSPSLPFGLFTECLLSRLIFQSGLVGGLGFGVSSSLTSLPFGGEPMRKLCALCLVTLLAVLVDIVFFHSRTANAQGTSF